jgi:N-acetyltransferase
MKLEPVTLEGRFVRLEPLAEEHADGLCEAIADGELWKLPVTTVPHPDEVPAFIADAHLRLSRGRDLAFATIDLATGRVAGSTRFMKIVLPDKRLEIGYTFLGKSWQRTRINTEAKLLMLGHAFEMMKLNRVELMTDATNRVSRTAIARIGAKEEGILRRHMVMRDGRIRDSVMYSIVAEEWPAIREDLERRLQA